MNLTVKNVGDKVSVFNSKSKELIALGEVREIVKNGIMVAYIEPGWSDRKMRILFKDGLSKPNWQREIGDVTAQDMKIIQDREDLNIARNLFYEKLNESRDTSANQYVAMCEILDRKQ